MTTAYHYLRFSSARQRAGSSSDRQVEWARRVCQERGYDLDETLAIADRGVSAFRGKHRTRGGLAVFLQACKAGRVPRGSVLLVECIDRLSREHVLEGFDLVKELLVDYGITILTNFPAQEYSRDNFDTTGWLLQAEFQRAYSESLAKSERSKFTWEKRRERAGREVVTARLPNWLKFENGAIVVDEPKAAVVREIFEMSAKGFGQQVIARRMRERGVPPLDPRSRTWYEGSVQRLLTSRAVLGEYQPRVLRGEERVAVGEPVRGYYPAVVTEGLWQESRRAMLDRRRTPGRITRTVSNLFTGVAFEGGEPLQRKQKGGLPYLQPANKSTPGIRYEPFERVVLQFVRAVRVYDGPRGDEREALRRQLDRLDSGIRKLRDQIDNDPGLADLLPTLVRWRRERDELAERLAATASPAGERHLHTRALIEALAAAPPDRLEALRREIRQAVRQTVERVDVTRTALPGPGLERFGVTLKVRLKTGEDHLVYYEHQSRRLLDAVHRHAGPGFEHWDALAAADPPLPRFAAAAAKRERCRQMAAAGRTVHEIAAELGTDRFSVYRYLRGDKRKLKRAGGE